MVEPLLDFRPASMATALRESSSGIIAEFKRRSPSKGWIKEEGKAEIIPLSYQQHGAAALSILTDEQFFGGCDAFIKAARTAGVTIPILYKNFIIDEYQLFQARLCGASAVLLIAADLTKLTSWDSKYYSRHTPKPSWSMPSWSPTCAALTTAISAHSSLMCRPPSVLPINFVLHAMAPLPPFSSVRVASPILLPSALSALRASVVSLSERPS